MSFLQRLFTGRKGRPSYWAAYKKSLDHAFPSNMPLHKVRFVVFDTETTGLDPTRDHLLSIGAIAVRNGRVEVADSFECLVQQPVVNKDSIVIHGLTPGRVMSGIKEEEAIRSFVKYIEGSILVAHHAAFDKAMINRAIKKKYRARLLNQTIDTAGLALRLENFGMPMENFRKGEYSLDSLCTRYHIRPQDRHTAAGDSFITAQLLLKLLRLAEKRGIRTVGNLVG